MLFLSILQENEQDRRQTRAGDVILFDDMEIDPPSPAVGAPSRSAPVERNVLLQGKQLKLRGDREKNIYKKLKTHDFVLTTAYDPALLQAIGMVVEFELIFRTIEWEDAWEIDEPGCKLLTI